jgi:hypothetical protein
MAQVTSAHVEYSLAPVPAPDPQSGPTYEISGTGAEHLSAGRPVAIDVIGRGGPSVQVHLLVTGGVSYGQFPKFQHGKPWAVVSPTSSNGIGRALVRTVQDMETMAAPVHWTAVATAATRVRTVGVDRIDGAQVMHYVLTVPVRPGTMRSGALAAVTAFSADMWVDGSGRLRRYRQSVAGQGSTMELLVTFSDRACAHHTASCRRRGPRLGQSRVPIAASGGAGRGLFDIAELGEELLQGQLQSTGEGRDGEERGRRHSTGLDLPQRLEAHARRRCNIRGSSIGAGLAQQRAQSAAALAFLGAQRRADHGVIVIPG